MDVSGWIDRHAAAAPGKAALIGCGRDYTYGELAALVGRLAGALAACGVGQGRCVAYLGYNSPEMVALLFACARLGALYMPLNWRLAAPEHRQMLADCPPAVMVVGPQFVAQTEGIRAALAPMTLVALGNTVPGGWRRHEDFLAQGEAAAPSSVPDADAPLLVCYTSGSTGTPKGVLLSHRALYWNALNSLAMHRMTAGDRILTTLPLFHVGGLNIQTTPALYAGCTVVLHPRFEADAVFDAIERDGITLTVLVPAQLDMMMANPRWAGADFSRLRMITTGSTVVPSRILRAVHDKGVPLAQVYGSTETCPIATCQTAADARARPGSAGRTAPHCAVRVVDEQGREVAPGATGEIVVRGPNVMNGYWNRPEATAAVLKDGWFHTGDMGHWDEDQCLFVDGRKKDMIISGGENIYPAEIENVLYECPGVEEAAVVGRSDARWGEVVVAVVVPKPGQRLTAEDVMKLFEGRLARYKHPKDVVFVEQLPRTALGKIRKEDVRQMVEKQVSGFSLPA